MDGTLIIDATETEYHLVNTQEFNVNREPHRFHWGCWCEPELIEMGRDMSGRTMRVYKHLSPSYPPALAESPFPLIEVVATTSFIIPATMDDLRALEEGE